METVAKYNEYQNTMRKKLEADLRLSDRTGMLEVYKSQWRNHKNQLLEKQKQYMIWRESGKLHIISEIERSQLEAQKKEGRETAGNIEQEAVELLEKIAQQNASISEAHICGLRNRFNPYIIRLRLPRQGNFILVLIFRRITVTNVYASNGGKVIKALYHYSYGNYILIEPGGGTGNPLRQTASFSYRKGIGQKGRRNCKSRSSRLFHRQSCTFEVR